MAEPQGKLPNVLTPTADLPREKWLAYRRQGIGGSDASAVLGILPFRTGVDLYYSLIETAKETGLDPFRYLTWVLERADKVV